MKLARYEYENERHVGVVDETEEHVSSLRCKIASIEELIVVSRDENCDVGEPVPLSNVRMLAPAFDLRRNIFCVGKNYREHAQEFDRSGFDSTSQADAPYVDDYPVIFTKPPTALIGSGASIESHSAITKQVDYEAELAVVIGKKGTRIPKDEAYEYVWAYSIINDVTARDLQKNHKQWFLGKSLDSFCPMGPWITTADEVDPENLEIKCWVNGELRQDASTSELIFDIPHLLHTLSSGRTLYPGDIISTGTPAGVGIGFTPPKFLVPGDSVRIEITGLGALINDVVKS